MRLWRFLAALLLTIGTTASQAIGAPAHFWLSTSSAAPTAPDNASVAITVGDSPSTLYLWARPMSGQKLRNFSLNVVADATGLDFSDGSYTIRNSSVASVDRFQFVFDSSSTPALESEESLASVMGGDTDELLGLQGFTVVTTPGRRGIGPSCLSGETDCVTAGDGAPAWLLAEFDIEATAAGTVNLHLQVGDSGINHESVAAGDYNYDSVVDSSDLSQWQDDFGGTTFLSADGNEDLLVSAADFPVWRDNLGGAGVLLASSLTEVVFGIDTIDGTDEPAHNASTDRSKNLAMDDPDAVITIAAAGPAVAATVPEPANLALLLGGLPLLRRKTAR